MNANRVLAVAWVLAGCASSQWRSRDTVLEVAFVAATAVDYAQSRDVVADCAEANPIIGPCGERVNLAAYALTVVVAHLMISSLLGHENRAVWQGVTLGVETNQVWMNHVLGY